ncbi:MAG: phosphoglycerate kinase [Candidatus Pacebacteria bacterium]|nr:phosphoglycerate kinase [Candidatus Paceibacterota bacterium]
MKYLSKLSESHLAGKTCLLRADFNLKSDKDVFRILESLPTIKFLLKNKAKILILSHRGRPPLLGSKKWNMEGKEFSLEPIAKILSDKLGEKVFFMRSFDFGGINMHLKISDPGKVFLLENLRFLKGEEENDKKLAKKLAGLGDIYINDAFAVSHRANASVEAITRYLPSYAGLLMEKEIKNLSSLFHPKRPLVVILGGAKITDKIGIIKNLWKQTKCFLVGSSVLNNSNQKEVKKYIKNKKVILPLDSIRVKDNYLDIGPKTIAEYKKILKKAKTIIWNGPVGMNENKRYAGGSNAIAKVVAGSRAFTVVGGGETTNLILNLGLTKKIKFLSTGGGAMLEFLAGKKLPGIRALK